MNSRRGWTAVMGATCAVLASGAAMAEVTKFEIIAVEHNALEGRVFGDTGTYGRIKARVTVAIDPAGRRNAHTGALYELDYLARDPKVLGLGFAATRASVAFLRREERYPTTAADDTLVRLRRPAGAAAATAEPAE